MTGLVRANSMNKPHLDQFCQIAFNRDKGYLSISSNSLCSPFYSVIYNIIYSII